MTITRGTPQADGGFDLVGTIEAAGCPQPLTCVATARPTGDHSVRLEGIAVLARTRFEMTWSPLGMASSRTTVSMAAPFDHIPHPASR